MFAFFLVMFAIVGIAMLFRAPLASDPVFAVAYAIVSVFFISINLYSLIVMRKTKRFCSAIPLFGGLYGAIALYLFGGCARLLFWLPLILDWGCLVIVITLYRIVIAKLRLKESVDATIEKHCDGT